MYNKTCIYYTYITIHAYPYGSRRTFSGSMAGSILYTCMYEWDIVTPKKIGTWTHTYIYMYIYTVQTDIYIVHNYIYSTQLYIYTYIYGEFAVLFFRELKQKKIAAPRFVDQLLREVLRGPQDDSTWLVVATPVALKLTTRYGKPMFSTGAWSTNGGFSNGFSTSTC